MTARATPRQRTCLNQLSGGHHLTFHAIPREALILETGEPIHIRTANSLIGRGLVNGFALPLFPEDGSGQLTDLGRAVLAHGNIST